MTKKKKKIGIMGGTFNPIHFGHLILAEAAYEQYHLDKVLIMPAKEPSHKTISDTITEEDRVEMVKRAIKGNDHFELSLLEINREGITYTIDTLTELHEEDSEIEYYFIMGADSLFHFNSWKEPEKILKLTNILVANRDLSTFSALNSQIDYLSDKYDEANISLLDTPNLEISSHALRKRVRQNLSIKYYVPESVEEYIKEHGLYQNKANVK
ncbi:MAG: nicotinate-nucleotide adenylyltransferase [Lachnospiraceae bacterium]|nr:nicotinate-nucleotide adenylyltransferase [Lachnospiraceae bacterium]MEE1341822.1 nicotinate-nucleotide adenylyltransferase [Lachnospiraceae bacterium]